MPGSYQFTPGIPIDATNARIRTPKIKIITPGGGATLGKYAQALRVEWARNNAFNKASIVLNDKRVGYAAGLNDESKIKPGSRVVIKGVDNIGGSSETNVLFDGRIMNIVHRWDDPADESVTVTAVGKRYDFFRHVIFGQIGYMASEETGEETETEGPYGGLGFFNGLPCIFNPKEFHKNVEPSEKKKGGKEQIGNSRKNTSAYKVNAFIGPERVFDCDPYSLSEPDSEGRSLAWSAYQMVQYVIAFMSIDPLNLGALPIDLPRIGDDIPFLLGASNGMESEYPLNVNVQNLPGNEAITRICAAAGFDWWVDPTEGNNIKFWRKGTGNLGKNSRFYFGDVSDGLAHTVAITNPPILTTSWNVNSGEITFNHLAVADTFISVTERCRVQNVFLLRKGWSDKINEFFVDVIGAGDDLEDEEKNTNQGKQTVFKYKDFETVRIIRQNVPGHGMGIMLVKRAGFNNARAGGIFEFGRKWVFDEPGRMADERNEDRPPYNFVVSGLRKVRDTTYCFGAPRPFLSRNIQQNFLGEAIPPRIHFGKYHPDQTSTKIEEDKKAKGSGNVGGIHKRTHTGTKPATNPFETGVEGKDGAARYPFTNKRGSVKVLKNVGGISIDGGNLEYWGFTIDPDTKKIFAFPPAVLGTIQHDQGIPVVSRKVLAQTFPFARRKVDGTRFKYRQVRAQDPTVLEESAKDDGSEEEAEGPDPTDETLIEEIDESDLLEEFTEAHIDSLATLRASGRVSIPTITTEYKLGDRINKLKGRMDFFAYVPNITFDLVNQTTEVTLESEAFKLIANTPAPVGTAEARKRQERIEQSLSPFGEVNSRASLDEARRTSGETPK